jgi:ribonuclease P protein component
MLNAKHRFHGYGSLRKVYGRSQSVRGTYISLRFADRTGIRPYRVAVVVGKKVHKSAVKRNRMRRRIYEAIRTSNVPEGKDLIFTVYSEKILETPPLELQTMISDLLNKLSLTN